MIVNLWNGSWIAAWGVGALTWGLMLWAAIAYRRRKRAGAPEQTKYNLPILGLFWFTARDQSELLTVKNDQQQTVQVVGYRWSWGFNYLDQDVYSTGMPVGQGTTNEPPTLVLPVGQKVRFELNSSDVIHSFWGQSGVLETGMSTDEGQMPDERTT